jgi:predicted transcriptional regulator
MLQKMKDEIELLSRHVDVIRAVTEHQPIGIMKLSELLDLPFHRIRYSLRILEQLGYIRATPSGAVVTPQTEQFLRHLDENLDELIALLESMKTGIKVE